MTMPNGIYRTKAGSEMRISGKYGGVSEVDFDWLEEGGCIECMPRPYDEDGQLVWDCEYCGTHRVDISPVRPAPSAADGNGG